MTAIGRTFLVGLLVVALTVATAGGVGSSATVGAGASTTAPSAGDASTAVGLAAAAPDEGGNETIDHRNPDEYDETGDLVGFEDWLAEELSVRLAESTAELDAGDYDDARGPLSEAYGRQLEQYDEIGRQTAGESQADRFDDAREAQRRLIDAAESHEELREEYERAIEAGDDERAHELARELEAEATAAEEASDELRSQYPELEEETGANFSDADENATDAYAAIEREQAEVRESQFVETELTLDPEEETVSFLEPLVAEGELRTVNGSAVADREVRLDVGNETTVVETDADGSFELEYRPTAEPLSTDALTVEYVPENESSYLGTEAAVNVTIEQVEPTVTDLEMPETVAYGDDVAVNGTLAVDGEPVDGVALEVVLEEEVIGEGAASNGTVNGTGEVPASVPDGERALGVRLPFDDRALAETTETEPVTVRETETALSITATEVDDREVRVDGTLTTTDGDPVANESVQVSLEEDTEPVPLDADGSFGETLEVPSDAGADVDVVVTYDGTGTNLAAAEAETTVTLADAGADGVLPSLPAWSWLLLGVLTVAAVAGVRRFRDETTDGLGLTASEGPRSGHERRTVDPAVVATLLSRAADQRASGRPNAAVQTCYVAVRRDLESRIDAEPGLTHWEFYRRWRRAGTDDVDALLFDLTETYERAAFDVTDVSLEEADGVIGRARRLLEDDLPDAPDEPER